MKEDKLFEVYKERFGDYAPEAPASVYEGVRSRLDKKSFWKFSAWSFNLYYVLGIVIAGGTMTSLLMSESTPVNGLTIEVADQQVDSYVKPIESIELSLTNEALHASDMKPVVSSSKSHSSKSNTKVAKLNQSNLPKQGQIAVVSEREEMEEMETIQPEVQLPFMLGGVKSIESNLYDALNSDDEHIYFDITVTKEVDDSEKKK